MPRIASVRTVLIAVLLAIVTLSARSQCEPVLLGAPFPGVDGEVGTSTMWDPDGPGPRAPVVVLGGRHAFAGNTVAHGPVTVDPTTGDWSALGSVQGRIHAFATSPAGELFAGGGFVTAGGQTCNSVARWNGTDWVPLGTGVALGATPGWIRAMAILPNGDVVAGGLFTSAGGVAAKNIARWDGTAWHAMAGGLGVYTTTDRVLCMLALPNGDLIAGGHFNFSTGSGPVASIARWDGSAWQPLGAGLSNHNAGISASVMALATLPSGDLVAGGAFKTAGTSPVTGIARWNGTSWQGMGPTTFWVRSLLTLPNGQLLAGLWGNSASTWGVRLWNGTTWRAIGAPMNNHVESLTRLPSGDVLATGSFEQVGNDDVRYLARWDGTRWSSAAEPNAGVFGIVQAVTERPNGDLVVAGRFSIAGDTAVENIARWDGLGWRALGNGIPFLWPNDTITALAHLPSGDLVASGFFVATDPPSTPCVIRWDGARWRRMGNGLQGPAWAMTVRPNGDLVAGGGFDHQTGLSNLARWDGNGWQSLGLDQIDGDIHALTTLPNGDLIVAGAFTTAAGLVANRIVRHDGTNWSALGSGVDATIRALALLPNGDLVAAGEFTAPYDRVARWNGTSWQPLGTGLTFPVRTLAHWPTDHLVAAGNGGGVALWNGTSWRHLATGLDDNVIAVAPRSNGRLTLGGRLSRAGPTVAARIADLFLPCPATVQTRPTNCVGAAGPITLAADTSPWLGATFRSTATGFAPLSIPIGLVGLTDQNAPLSQVLGSAALPNCSLLVNPDVVWMQFGGGTVAQFALPLPNDPAFVDLRLHHQFLEITADGLGNLATAAGSNALTITVGAL